MASTTAHRSTGWAVGIIAAALASRRLVDPYGLWMLLTFVAAYFGGTAPDWLENAWWSRGSGRQLWIAHRSWTHWGVAWVALLAWAYLHLHRYSAAGPVFGFAAGGIMHLLADWPNPLGVPWLGTRRHSLRWWKSGRCDYLIILAAWIAALFVADGVWWNGMVWQKVQTLSHLLIHHLPPVIGATLSRFNQRLP